MSTFDDILVRIACVTVCTSEFTTDVRIDRPKPHASVFRRVGDRFNIVLDKLAASETLIENDQLTRVPSRVAEQIGLRFCMGVMLRMDRWVVGQTGRYGNLVLAVRR